MRVKVLLVEDEELIGEMIRINLEADEGYEVAWAKDGETALRLAEDERFDIIILDVMLPGADGIQVTRTLRKRGVGTPILMLTARSDTPTKVQGLDTGADDYLTKPFDLPELLARVRAAIRRSQASREVPSDAVLRFGRYEVNLRTGTAQTNEGEVILTEKERALIELFWRHQGEVLTRADILDEVWGMDVSPTERTVDNFLLRYRKLFDDPEQPVHFQTARSRGYRFIP
ncbi:MAG: response regulator transcription factor [Acidobacteriota bacterium]